MKVILLLLCVNVVFSYDFFDKFHNHIEYMLINDVEDKDIEIIDEIIYDFQSEILKDCKFINYIQPKIFNAIVFINSLDNNNDKIIDKKNELINKLINVRLIMIQDIIIETDIKKILHIENIMKYSLDDYIKYGIDKPLCMNENIVLLNHLIIHHKYNDFNSIKICAIKYNKQKIINYLSYKI